MNQKCLNNHLIFFFLNFRLWCFCLSWRMFVSFKQPFKCYKSCDCTNFGAFNGPRNSTQTMLCSHETLWHFSTLLGLKVINYRILLSFWLLVLKLWWKVLIQLLSGSSHTYLKCSNCCRQILILSANFGCLFTFCNFNQNWFTYL